ncbi:MAG: hypothetical protein AB7N76_02930 [Planctomycetota bacterium]
MSDTLDRIDVASPCEVSWESMQGDERVRFCGHCNQSVYRLTEMPRAEAMDLLERVQGGEKVCVRFARRADGTVVTNDCPTTVRRGRRRPWAQVGAWAAGLASAVTAGMTTGCFEADASTTVKPQQQQPQPQQPQQQQPPQQQPPQQQPPQLPEIQGDMACPTEPETPPKQQPTSEPEEMGKMVAPPPREPQERMGRMKAPPETPRLIEKMGEAVAPEPQRGRPLPRAGE